MRADVLQKRQFRALLFTRRIRFSLTFVFNVSVGYSIPYVGPFVSIRSLRPYQRSVLPLFRHLEVFDNEPAVQVSSGPIAATSG